VTGPAGIEERFIAAAEALFPGSSKTPRAFDLIFRTYQEREWLEENGVAVKPFEVSHPSGAPPYALRFDVDGKVITFSGDTEWVASLADAARDADLFITEFYAFEKPARYHLNWRTLVAELPHINARSVLLTHMGPDMLINQHKVSYPGVKLAVDGMKLSL
jgi:ribonuclease BN (tRNA processing enzyme)